jgi:precorrin-6Y C5,15-methyltransferase (decarboxylating)
MSLTLVLGGARSGKSARGEALAMASGLPVTYVATAEAAEMPDRIAAHVARRPSSWRTVEAGARLELDDSRDCVLFDGLGVWIARVQADAIAEGVDALIAAAAARPVIVVAEEAGLGLLPIGAVARTWLDRLGEAVQCLSAAANLVELVVAGRPIVLTNPSAATVALRDHLDGPVSDSGADHAVNALGGVISVVGIGADGWSGLGERSRAAILGAEVVVGSERQLSLVPDDGFTKRLWPSPIDSLLDELVESAPNAAEGSVCVLASGDPMLHGIGATLVRRLGPERITIHPHPSALAFACARLGWPEAEVDLVSAVGRPVEVIAPLLQPGRRLVVYVTGADGAARVARSLCERGFGPSRFVVLEQLGGPDERMTDVVAGEWDGRALDPLHAVAIECRASPGALTLGRHPGLPDAAYESDGQLTKWPIRAMTLAALRPAPGELLWDVGAGSGSIGIEWLRAEPRARAIAIESREDRAARISANALHLGVPSLRVVHGVAPGVLAGLDLPDVVFVGGGLNEPGLLETCVQTGARIVANAVTLEGEQALYAVQREHGGSLLRIELSHAEPLGSLEAWRPQRPVVQWSSR